MPVKESIQLKVSLPGAKTVERNFKKLNQSMKSLQTSLKRSSKNFELLNKIFQAGKQNLNSTQNDFKKLNRTLKSGAKSANQVKSDFGKLNQAIKSGTSGANKAKDGFKKLGDSVKKTGGNANSARKNFSKLNKVTSATNGIFLKLIATLGGFAILKNLTNVIKDFELEMAKIQGVLGATSEEMKSLTDTAKLLGSTTIFSASQAASGLLELSKAGLDASQSVDALPTVLRGAQAGNVSLARSADILTEVLAQFGLETSKSTQILDVMVATAQKSKVDLDTLGRAFSFAGGLSSSLGLSVQDTAAAIGALRPFFGTASRAGRNFTTALAQLTKETPKLNKALEGTGLSARDVNPALNSLTEVIENLEKAFGTDVAKIANTFDKQTTQVVNGLIKQKKVFGELREELHDVGGTGEQVAKIMGDTLFGDIKSLQSVVEGLKLKIGDAGLTGALRTTIQHFTAFLNVLNESSLDFYKSIDASDDFIKRISKLNELMAQTGRVFVIAGKSIEVTFTTIGKSAAVAFGVIKDALSLLINPTNFKEKIKNLSNFATTGFKDISYTIKEDLKSIGEDINFSISDEAETSLSNTLDSMKKIREEIENRKTEIESLRSETEKTSNISVSTEEFLGVDLRGAEKIQFEINEIQRRILDLKDELKETQGHDFFDELDDKLKSGLITNFDRAINSFKKVISEQKKLQRAVAEGNITEEKRDSLLDSVNHKMDRSNDLLASYKRSLKDVKKETSDLQKEEEKRIKTLEDLQRQAIKGAKEQVKKLKEIAKEEARARKKKEKEEQDAFQKSKEIFEETLSALESITSELVEIYERYNELKKTSTRLSESQFKSKLIKTQIAEIDKSIAQTSSEEVRESLKAQKRALEQDLLENEFEIKQRQIDLDFGIGNANAENLKSGFNIVREILEAIASIGGKFVGGGAGAGGGEFASGLFHSGGVIRGKPNEEVTVSARAGEVILNRSQVHSLLERRNSGVKVNVIDNRSNQTVPAQVQTGQTEDDINIILNDFVNNSIRSGKLDGAMQSRYGVTSQGY